MTAVCSVDDEECSSKGKIRLGLCVKHYGRMRAHGNTRTVKPNSVPVPIEERFWAKVQKGASCWLWVAAHTPEGYGLVSYDSRSRLAHRVSWALTTGTHLSEVPTLLDHKCHVRNCVNPDHLQPATQAENTQNLTLLKTNTASGVRGVTWCRNTKKWRARAKHNKQDHLAGYFGTVEEARIAVIQLRNSLFTNNIEDRLTV